MALEWEKRRFVALKEIKRRLRCSDTYAGYLAHTLQKKGWLDPLGNGNYQLIGAERGPEGVREMNPYVIARFLPKSYFFAYRIACLHYGLVAQVPTVIHAAVRRRKRPVDLKNVRFEFVVLNRRFGYLAETLKVTLPRDLASYL